MQLADRAEDKDDPSKDFGWLQGHPDGARNSREAKKAERSRHS